MNSFPRAISLGLIVSVVSHCCAQNTPSVPAVERSFARDAKPLAAFDKEMKMAIKEGKIVGCSAMLVKDQKVVYSSLWGARDREKQLPVEKDTIWRIYSMSKPVTSVAIMQLVDRKKIKLDEPVHTYLPEFKDLKVQKGDELVACERAMTVRDLLRHTSGLTYGFFGNTKVDQQYRRARVLRGKNLQEMVGKLAKIPLLNQPGSRWHYSISTDVLGRVVEVASGKSFKEYLAVNVFQPLKMKDTFFTVPKAKQPRLAQMYAPDGKGGLKPANSFASYRFLNENELYSGGGGLCSTMHDYLQFCRMLVGEGELDGARILAADTVKQMFRDQLPKAIQSKRFKFGLGFRISQRGDVSWGGAAGTRFWVDPKQKMAGIYMIQINPFRSVNYGDLFKRAIYEVVERKADE